MSTRLLGKGWRITSLGLLLPVLFSSLSGCCWFNQPPVAVVQAIPSQGPAPLTVSFDASRSTDPDGEVRRYSWEFGDGGSGSGLTTNHTYTRSGTFTATLTVRDRCGATDRDRVTIEVTKANIPPVML